MINQSDPNETTQYKKLYLSIVQRKLAGVCGGIAEYFEIDPTVVRLSWMIMTLTTGVLPGIVAYVVAILMMPKPYIAPELNEAEA